MVMVGANLLIAADLHSFAGILYIHICVNVEQIGLAVFMLSNFS